MTVNKAKMVSELLGLGIGGGELQKLTIYYERAAAPGQGTIPALFNPSEITKTRSAVWEQQHAVGQPGRTAAAVEQEFRSVDAETFSIELFFDTYESRSSTLTGARAAATFLPASVIPARESTDVRQHTDQIVRLVGVDPDLDRPPVCDLRWGVFDIFTGVLFSVQQRFTLFLADGTPVRATLSCDFAEVGAQGRAKAAATGITTVTAATGMARSRIAAVRTVKRSDSLQSLAAAEYGDPGQWRAIAKANGIVNPRNLPPGTSLAIPRLHP